MFATQTSDVRYVRINLIWDFFFKEIGFTADGWLQHVHNLSSVKTVPVTSYIEVLQNVDLYLFNVGGSEV